MASSVYTCKTELSGRQHVDRVGLWREEQATVSKLKRGVLKVYKEASVQFALVN
jgi:hypothetical protein